eukprot:2840435-Prymnesium_polylepis.1
MLEDSDWKMRQAAVNTLGKLAPEDLATHTSALAARLKDSFAEGHSGDWWVPVINDAVVTLRKLAPDVLATQAPALAATLNDKRLKGNYSLSEVLITIGMLPPGVLAMHDAALAAKLKDSHERVRRKSAEALGKLAPDAPATVGASQLWP